MIKMNKHNITNNLISSIVPNVMSPSFLEQYIQCPYQWMINRGVRIKDDIQQFQALDQGNLIHDTLAMFYKKLQIEKKTVKPELLQEYTKTLDNIYEENVSTYIDKYYPLSEFSEIDKEQIHTIKSKLRKYLYFDANSFLGFTPWLIEETIEGEYAGQKFCGRVDRVDRFNNSFIVIDYKLGNSDAVSFTHSNAQYKYQTALYASLIERTYNMRCVGVFYIPMNVSLHANNNSIGGALDPHFFNQDDIFIKESNFEALCCTNEFTYKDKSIQCDTFRDFLQFKENCARPLVKQLKEGRIYKNPENPKGAYCPILSTCRKCLA